MSIGEEHQIGHRRTGKHVREKKEDINNTVKIQIITNLTTLPKMGGQLLQNTKHQILFLKLYLLALSLLICF